MGHRRAETRSIDIRTLQQTRAKAAPHVFRPPIAYNVEESGISQSNHWNIRYNASA